MGRSTRRSKARRAARMTCDCLSPVRSVSRSKILRSASVSRIVVFSNFVRRRTTHSTAIQMPNCVANVWRRRNLARNWAMVYQGKGTSADTQRRTEVDILSHFHQVESRRGHAACQMEIARTALRLVHRVGRKNRRSLAQRLSSIFPV